MLFFLSGAGRVVATLLLWRTVPEDRPEERLPEAIGPDAVEPMAAG
ncbi:MAG: hypothetical protein WD939_01490 [Dehalococcoidia bacterium]